MMTSYYGAEVANTPAAPSSFPTQVRHHYRYHDTGRPSRDNICCRDRAMNTQLRARRTFEKDADMRASYLLRAEYRRPLAGQHASLKIPSAIHEAMHKRATLAGAGEDRWGS